MTSFFELQKYFIRNIVPHFKWIGFKILDALGTFISIAAHGIYTYRSPLVSWVNGNVIGYARTWSKGNR